MRSRWMGTMLAASLLVTGCSDGAGRGPGGSAGGRATGDGAWQSLGGALSPLVGATGDFTVQGTRRGCGDNPFVGRSPVEILALTTTYTAIATTGYTDGIRRAQAALGLQQIANQALISDLDALKGGLGLDAAFSSFRMIEVNNAAAEALARDLQRRLAAGPLAPAVMAELREANRALMIGNHFQVDAAVGAVLLAAFVGDSLNGGGNRDLARIMLAEVDRGRAGPMAESLASSPATLMNLVFNLAEAYNLHRTLSQVTDFREAERAAAMLGLEVDFRALRAVAAANARSLRDRYPAELAYRQTGTIVRTLMINALERQGVSNIATGPALALVMGACGGVFGDTTMVAGGDQDRLLRGAEIVLAQEALIDLRYLTGRADGIAGRVTQGAVVNFQRDRGLVPDGRLTRGLLAELRLAQGERAAPGSGRAPERVAGTGPRQTDVALACIDAGDGELVGPLRTLAAEVVQQLADVLGEDVLTACR